MACVGRICAKSDSESTGKRSIRRNKFFCAATLADRIFEPGEYEASWHGRDEGGRPLSSGVYVIRLEAGGYAEATKAVILK